MGVLSVTVFRRTHRMSCDVEVAIAGGGPAGSACAAALARRGVRVFLIEASPGTPRAGELLRPSARPALEALGLDPERDMADHAPFTGVRSAWGQRRLGSTGFIRNPYGNGWCLDRAGFDGILRARAVAAGARLVCDVRLGEAMREAGGWRLVLSDGSTLTARILVDCTGRSGRHARAAGAERVAEDRLVAFAGVLEARADNAGERCSDLIVEATEEGWWYTAALPRGRRVVAYLTDSDLPGAYGARTCAGMARLLRQAPHVEAALAAEDAAWCGEPQAFPAGTAWLRRPAGRDWLAAGDAALASDPLSGAGLEQALLGGLAAARACEGVLAGDVTAADAYAAENETASRDMLAARGEAYARETRWPWSPFWARRHAARHATREVAWHAR